MYRTDLPHARSTTRFLLARTMGRGIASKGKRDPSAAPDWLGQRATEDAPQQRAAEEKPRKRKPDDDDDDDSGPSKKGIQWKPLAFLVLMVLPGLAPILIQVSDALPGLGVKLPSFASSPYRPCLQEFYADWAPEKLGGIDDTLLKYEGREKQLFGILSRKYGKRANFARCVPMKTDKA